MEIELPMSHEKETQFRLYFPNGIVKWISDEFSQMRKKHCDDFLFSTMYLYLYFAVLGCLIG